MAAASPAQSANSSDTATTGNPVRPSPGAAVLSANLSTRTDTPPKTLRGLNKPKCRVCGNVARSRCPYQSCKSCCARNQNPCHIHVLKASATFPDKTTTSSSPIFDQQGNETSSSGNSHRVASLRQLSNHFVQFNNVQIQLRSKKPLTRKEATVINEWRFAKLRELQEGKAAAENEAFDRYMQNISLLEEIFSMRSSDERPSILNLNHSADDGDKSIGLKLKLNPNATRSDSFKRRVQQVVDRGLEKLRKCESADGFDGVAIQTKLDKRLETAKSSQAEGDSSLSDLIDKLNKARNMEDLKSCIAMKSQLFSKNMKSSQTEAEDLGMLEKHATENFSGSGKELHNPLPKFARSTEIDQDTLSRIDVHFSSLEQIHNL